MPANIELECRTAPIGAHGAPGAAIVANLLNSQHPDSATTANSARWQKSVTGDLRGSFRTRGLIVALAGVSIFDRDRFGIPSWKLRGMHEDLKKALETNYNAVGVALIEKLYSDNYLSLSGANGTDRLFQASRLPPDGHVLDIGCGLGGPAMRLAEVHGCKVTGVDLVETNVHTARARASAAGLDRLVDIQQADATALGFLNGTFDAVFSQDALCHFPDKAAALAEAARVLKPGGAVGFTDWVEFGDMAAPERESVLDALSAPNLQTPTGYCDLLVRLGFEIEVNEDISTSFAAAYEEVMRRLGVMEAEISSKFSPRVFAIMMEKNGVLQTAFANNTLGGQLIVARRT